MTLSGLKSRCTTPAACAAASPRPAARNTSSTSRQAAAAPAARRERLALDELHGDEDVIADGAGVVDRDDVGVRDARHGLRLAQQARAAVRRGGRPTR